MTGRTCGTASGYKGHRKLGEEPCASCRAANSRYERERLRQPEKAQRARDLSAARRAAKRAARPPRVDDMTRLLRRVEVQENGCWAWVGAKCNTTGYGRAWFGGQTITAHLAFYRAVGRPALPDGMELDHVCHSRDLSCREGNLCPHRRCVNPDHLEPVTALVNQQRAVARITHCPQGHEYSPGNTRLNAAGARNCITCNRDCARERARRLARDKRTVTA